MSRYSLALVAALFVGTPTTLLTPDAALDVTPVDGPAVLGIGAHQLEERDLAELHALGIRHVRHTLYAALWERHEDYRDDWEARVRAAAAEGIELLVVVHMLPDAWSPEYFGSWIADRAASLPVEAWQIGNEIPFDDHLVYHRAAYDSIKARAPHALVVTMALLDENFARAFDAPADVYAVHIYGLVLGDEARDRRSWLPADREMWITEFGVAQVVVPSDWGDWELVQRDEWEAVYLASDSYGRIYGYQLRTEEPVDTHGVIRPNGSYRPTAEWLAGRDRAPAETATSVTDSR